MDIRDLNPNELLLSDADDYRTFDYPMCQEVQRRVGFTLDFDDAAVRLYRAYEELTEELGAVMVKQAMDTTAHPNIVEVKPEHRDRIIDRCVRWQEDPQT
ncbi:hypothetical protein BJF83_18695 [Nocardiopsis sp. CNR-923]|uniref:hypothetical protein n=1 Tax=Nocardiopsis sp. CNR-923 TaxID=1904965 RepID=UPI00096481FC|nr:hypothetical protein [Nocardiopsis sp. CNR-923]OLT27215.1 hypothetical protein BJF83_18695 [Nocardiopsis sp. CNR-923]